MRVIYRLSQFWHILTAKPLPEAAWSDIISLLSPGEVELFGRFSFADQWHSYRVLQTLRDAGCTHPDLLVASLLHDVGKTRISLSIWERSLIVLCQLLWPQRIAVWGKEDGRGWRRPFVLKMQHPAWGAEMAQAVGSSPLVVSLICRHQDKLPPVAVSQEDKLLGCLQWADDQN